MSNKDATWSLTEAVRKEASKNKYTNLEGVSENTEPDSRKISPKTEVKVLADV
jgi:hypothetical protein